MEQDKAPSPPARYTPNDMTHQTAQGQRDRAELMREVAELMLDAGVAPGGKSYIRTLLPRHRLIMRMELKGFTKTEIAEAFNMSVQQVCNITNSDIYLAERERLQAEADGRVVQKIVDIRSKIEELSGKSVTQLEEMLDGKRELEKKRLDMCFGILRAGGHYAPERVDHRHSGVIEYAEAARRAYAKRRAANEAPITLIKVNGHTVNLAPNGALPSGTEGL